MQTPVKTLGAVMVGSLFMFSMIGFGCMSSEPEKVARKPFGQTCAADADCESSQCAVHGKICSKTCASDRECGDGLVCRGLDSGSGMQCAKPEGSSVGSSCQAASECDHGLCVKKADAPSEPGFCSRLCIGTAECPDGYKICDSLTDGAPKMCFQGDDKIPIDRAKFAAPVQIVGTPTKPTTSSSSSSSSTSSSSSSGSSSSGSSSSSSSSTGGPVDAGAPRGDAGNGRPPLVFDAGTSRPPLKFPTKK